MPLLDQYNIPYEPALIAVSSTLFVAIIQGEQADLTFIPVAVGGDAQYIRNRSFVGTRTPPAGQAWPSSPASLPSRDELLRRLAAARREASPWLRHTVR
jgi:hypothetical protein